MLYGAQTNDPPLPGDAGIVQEASERWHACKDWQGVEDERSREDIKFANADARNAWQWPTKIYAERSDESGDNLPCLTINNVRTHNDLIINQMSKNDFGIKIRPTGGKASYKSAQVMQSLIRRIEQISSFPAQRRRISEHQVDGGIGYMLIETAYVSERSFDQDIFLKAARDPTGVYLDPWITKPDGSDANFGFIFERLPRKEFNRKYPNYKDKVGSAPLDSAFANWLSDKEVMLAKYYRKNAKKDTLIAYKMGDGTEVEKLSSEIKKESGEEIYDRLIEDIENGVVDGRMREVTTPDVEWFLIAGDKIVERGKWAGKFIPICRCVGRELVIDNTLDRKGHTRPLIDAQRMLNYSSSLAVEIVALQPKSTFLGPARAFEGQEQYKDLNVKGYAAILYNDIDEDAPPELQKIEPPERLDPPRPSEAHQLAMQTAERQMMLISGQWQSETGQQDSQFPESGRAINARQQQGETATYHFPEHQTDMLRFVGTQLLDLIPKIYDTKRQLHVMGDDGKRYWLRVDPEQDKALEEMRDIKEDEEAVRFTFNPSFGEYECVSDPGPDYATQRQEAWDALKMAMQANSELIGVAGDELFRYGDFPGAEQLADRLNKWIKATHPYLFADGQDPALLTAQQQNAKLTQLNGELVQKLAELQLLLRGKEELRDIEAFKADTGRMDVLIKAIKSLMPTPAMRAQFEHEIAQDARQHIYGTMQAVNDAALNGSGIGSDAGQ